MTMTSDQCDELREKAKLLRGYVDGLSAPYVIPSTKELMALTMLDSAGRMEQAAGTILELRDDLQRANDAVRDAEHDESMAWDRVRKAEAENAKLVDVLHEVEAEAVHAYRCLQQDCVTTANSSQHFFDKWWHAECELDRLKTENTELRELMLEVLRELDAAPQYDTSVDCCTMYEFAERIRKLRAKISELVG